ncbi:MAG: hypothetical protein HQL04_07935 [Nitrospirae bacterium]|nr:hypothetical protein [Nitrospirota bacterium]
MSELEIVLRDYWLIACLVYFFLAVVTFIPIIRLLIIKIELNPGGASFETAMHFSDLARKRLSDHYSRLTGTLGFWKKMASVYKSFHYYCVIWTILSSWAVPLIGAIAPQTDKSSSKWLIVIISSHVALAMSLHRGMKVAEGMKAFRHGESEFYDLYRKLLDRPHLFGTDETEQIESYFAEVEKIRKLIRNAETDSIPQVDSIKSS